MTDRKAPPTHSNSPTPIGDNDSPMTRLMSLLAQKRDAGTLTQADIQAANAELAGRAFHFEADGRGGFVVVLTGMLPDVQQLRSQGRRS
jgi:hypothetical protein